MLAVGVGDEQNVGSLALSEAPVFSHLEYGFHVVLTEP